MTAITATAESVPAVKPLPILVRIVYGTGDWGLAGFTTLRTLLLGIFFTDVVGLDARLASVALFVGLIWDAINDPLVGMLTDRGLIGKRMIKRLGRRRPFLLIFAIPLGLSFVAMWAAPGFDSQIALLIYVTFMYALSDTIYTLISVPYWSLTPELTPDYDERTTLTTWRMGFNLVSSLATAVVAPEIVKGAPTLQQGYTNAGIIFGAMAIVPFLALVFVTRNIPSIDYVEDNPSILESFKSAWKNIPFRYATGIHLLNWMAVDLVALMLPFFITYWIEGGRQVAEVTVPVLGKMTTESIIFGIFFTTAAATVPLWGWAAHRFEKHTAYIAGMAFWFVVQLVFLTMGQGQRNYAFLLAFMAGIGVSTAHVIPDSMFPDVMEWDELFTGKRREGVYYGVRSFVRKVATAVALGVALQILGVFGYQQPTSGVEVFTQSPSALLAIRILAGPGGAILLTGAIGLAFFYPLTRARHTRVRALLSRRRALAAAAVLTDEAENPIGR